MRLGLSTSPACSTGCPAVMSAARRPTCCRGYTGVKIRTSSDPATRSVSSTITTASAPCGIGAPVAIWMHSPAADRPRRDLRGVDRLDRAEDLRVVASRRRTCPRRARRSRPWRRDRTAARPSTRPVGVAMTRPPASRSGIRSVRAIGVAASRIVASASSSEMVSRIGHASVWSPAQLPHDVTELGKDQLGHAEADGVFGSRQHEDRRAARDAGAGAREHRGAADLLRS